MHDAGVSLLAAWESLYVIVGSSSAGLTGLMFVVVTLIPEAQSRGAVPVLGFSVFSTPTIVYFCSALLVSAILSAPWGALSQAGLAIALTGLAGLVFVVFVACACGVCGARPTTGRCLKIGCAISCCRSWCM